MTERQLDNPQNLIEQYKSFKEREGYSKAIGIIGGSDDKNLQSYEEILLQTFESVKLNFGKFAVVSGGTRGGVPESALKIAKIMELPTIGVYPLEKAEKVAFEKVDFTIAVPPQPLSNIKWGIETSTLVGIPDVFILIDGGWGTLTEISMIMKRNLWLADKKLPLTPVIGLAGSGGVADILTNLAHVLTTAPGVYFEAHSAPYIAEKVTKILNNS